MEKEKGIPFSIFAAFAKMEKGTEGLRIFYQQASSTKLCARWLGSATP